MTITEMIMRVTNPVFQRIGLKLVKDWSTWDAFVSLEGMSQREIINRLVWLKEHLNFTPSSSIDVGASNGLWALPFLKIFPETQMLMVEPLEDHKPKLEEITWKYPKVVYRQALLGESDQIVRFNEFGYKSSLFGNATGEGFGQVHQRQMTTLDKIIEELSFPPPELVKLDVEGAELSVLKGALKALKSAEIVEMEVSLLPFKKDLPLLDDVVTFMAANGFRVFDCFGIYGRPLDGMPVQGECLFIRKDSRLISNYRWADGLTWS
jgi:FkbM family methyltransferase